MRTLRRAASWTIVVAATTGALALLDGVPSCVAGARDGEPRAYASLAELEGALGVRLAMPYFFPDRLEWPPAVLLGRKRPLQIYAEVRDRVEAPTAPPTLVIRAWAGGDEHFHPAVRIEAGRSGTLPLHDNASVEWRRGRDRHGREWYRVRATGPQLTTELTARLSWEEFQQMIHSFDPGARR